ncbi:MAG: hypothetical protein Q8O67_07025 [Deltaproteobacteria bacterium]|nr:hypothetical protein [Deltaproteobacteria bacterium]
MSTAQKVIVLAVVVSVGCSDPPPSPPLASKVQAEAVAVTPPVSSLRPVTRPVAGSDLVDVTLLSVLGPTFPAPDYALEELSAADFAAFPNDSDGFRVHRVKEQDDLLVMGRLRVTEANSGTPMNSYTAGLMVRAIDPKTRVVKAVFTGSAQLTGTSAEQAVSANARRFEGINGGLAQKLRGR